MITSARWRAASPSAKVLNTPALLPEWYSTGPMGVASMFQTLGFRSKKSASLIQKISLGYAAVIWVGFVSIPVAIRFGFVK